MKSKKGNERTSLKAVCLGAKVRGNAFLAMLFIGFEKKKKKLKFTKNIFKTPKENNILACFTNSQPINFIEHMLIALRHRKVAKFQDR